MKMWVTEANRESQIGKVLVSKPLVDSLQIGQTESE
jgi:hypothetical protein